MTNGEPAPVSLNFIGGSLWADPMGGPGPQQIRNLTTSRYTLEIPAGASESISYKFTTELHPQDLQLQLVAVLTDSKGASYTVQAYNETVGIVEPDAGFFDPQM